MEATEETPATTESFGLLETDSRPAQPTIVSNLNNQLQSSTNSLGGKSKRWRSICCWLSSTVGCAICVLLAAILIRAWTVKEIFVRNVIDPNPSMITVTRFGRQLDNHVDFQRTGKALSTLRRQQNSSVDDESQSQGCCGLGMRKGSLSSLT